MYKDKPNSAAGQPEKKIRPPDEEKKTDPCLVLNDELRIFLNLRHLPAYVNEAQTAALLGLKRDHIPILAAYGFLIPMGEPAPNGEKLYARVRVLKNSENEEWLTRAKAALSDHWREKNARKAKSQAPSAAQTIPQLPRSKISGKVTRANSGC